MGPHINNGIDPNLEPEIFAQVFPQVTVFSANLSFCSQSLQPGLSSPFTKHLIVKPKKGNQNKEIEILVEVNFSYF